MHLQLAVFQETNYLRNQIQNEREKQNQWKNLYFQEHAELVELKRRFQAFQTAMRAQGDDVNNNNQSEKWELRGRKVCLNFLGISLIVIVISLSLYSSINFKCLQIVANNFVQ